MKKFSLIAFVYSLLSCMYAAAQPWIYNPATSSLSASNISSFYFSNVLLKPNNGYVTTLDFQAKDYVEMYCSGDNGPAFMMFKNISDLYPHLSGSMSLMTGGQNRISIKRDGDIIFGDGRDRTRINFNTSRYASLHSGNSRGSAVILGADSGYYAGAISFRATNADEAKLKQNDVAYRFEVNSYKDSGKVIDTATYMTIRKNGKVVIGSDLNNRSWQPGSDLPDGYALMVQQGILTEKLRVANSKDPLNWADFVFNEEYDLRPLSELEKYIAVNKHLPEMPTAAEVGKDGIDVAAMEAKLLQKIEELTLYIIQQQKEIDALKKQKRH
ncbi:MAG: hypothetical protein EOP56_10625 [Sphingobacteriales bacterium]|nr:MAG: hypothetical protein EOP56_10625 [Sphingobacteriales bacterium]